MKLGFAAVCLSVLTVSQTVVAAPSIELPETCVKAIRAEFQKKVDDFVIRGAPRKDWGATRHQIHVVGVYKYYRYYVHVSSQTEINSGRYKGQFPGLSHFATLNYEVYASGACHVVNTENDGSFPFGG